MKKVLVSLLFSPLMAFAGVFGEPVAYGLHTVTRHDPSNGANDFNPGFYVKTDKNYLLGAYYNSYSRMAYYAGITTDEYYRFRISVVGVTGYFAPVTFIAIPSFRLHTFENGGSVYISGSPMKITPEGQAILHLSFEWKL